MFFLILNFFGRFPAEKSKFGQFCWCKSEKKFSKIDFFDFFKKWSRMGLNAKYWLEMCFEHFEGSFGTIFDHLWWSAGHLKKVDFFKKMHFLRFFGIFGFGRFGCKKALKTSKFPKFFQIWILYIQKMLADTLDAVSRCVDTILQTFENMSLFQLFQQNSSSCSEEFRYIVF